MSTLDKAIRIANQRGAPVPRHLFAFMDDCWGLISYPRPGLRSNDSSSEDPASLFNDCLNEVHPRVQFTREEEQENTIAFLDVKLMRHTNGKLTTSVYRKPSNTNLTIRPQSCQHPRTAIATFKAELCRAHRICSSADLLKKEIEFITDLFAENGHNRVELKGIADAYSPPSLNTTSHTKKRPKAPNTSTKPNEVPENLFDVLPFRNTDMTNEEERRPFARIPYLPGNIFHQIRRSLSKAGVNTCPTSGKKLVDLLCGKNKTHPPQEDKKGVYMIQCPCNPKSIYVGQTIRAIKNRCQEHKVATEKNNWHHSGIAQHKEHCNVEVDWNNPTILKTMSDKSKRKLAYDLKVREALEIRRHNCGPGHGLNEDYGAYVKTSQWNVVFHSMEMT